jgi:hypothetical protein
MKTNATESIIVGVNTIPISEVDSLIKTLEAEIAYDKETPDAIGTQESISSTEEYIHAIKEQLSIYNASHPSAPH